MVRILWALGSTYSVVPDTLVSYGVVSVNLFECSSELTQHDFVLDRLIGSIDINPSDTVLVDDVMSFSFISESHGVDNLTSYLWNFGLNEEEFSSTLNEGQYVYYDFVDFETNRNYQIKLEVTTSNECVFDFVDSIYVQKESDTLFLNLKENNREEKVIVYPTISGGEFFVKLEGFGGGSCEIVLYSLSGNELDLFKVEGDGVYVLELVNFSSGSYIVSVRGENLFKGILIMKK